MAEDRLARLEHLFAHKWLSDGEYALLRAAMTKSPPEERPEATMSERYGVAAAELENVSFALNDAAKSKLAKPKKSHRGPQRCSLCHKLRKQHKCTGVPCPDASVCGVTRLHSSGCETAAAPAARSSRPSKRSTSASASSSASASASASVSKPPPATAMAFKALPATEALPSVNPLPPVKALPSPRDLPPTPAAQPDIVFQLAAYGIDLDDTTAALELPSPQLAAKSAFCSFPALSSLSSDLLDLEPKSVSIAAPAPAARALKPDLDLSERMSAIEATVTQFASQIVVPCPVVHAGNHAVATSALAVDNSLFVALDSGEVVSIFVVNFVPGPAADANAKVVHTYRNWVFDLRRAV
ncbi:uncharacterized protein AMSG_02251 [Thecamonas trahens ATCC 50062]|uniref:Uncharacterized protein n=1 Tax=Thecamonas trahens ATCC 50062 TaxID=461836 RepID=A0A0L0DVS5_THETB|nr:hypothetical protein AMSG_02251 [Thecamonas trahens ATCC 50062]KNC56282.1 hypothetical protein AMSG_02251 [Thecamonas trahens ATCC 50062]|eukprot:XP_013760801.1 hypothetical protein AMSG_02251 [Thecamonas trahens ATCC 50062]